MHAAESDDTCVHVEAGDEVNGPHRRRNTEESRVEDEFDRSEPARELQGNSNQQRASERAL